MTKDEVKDVDFSTQKMKEDLKENKGFFIPDMPHAQREIGEIDEYRNKLSSIYFDAVYMKTNAIPWLSEISDKLKGYQTIEVMLLREKERLVANKQELKKYEDELFLKEKNIRTADATMCVNINKLISKTEDILGELKNEKEKMKLFEGDMYAGNKEECDDNKEECDGNKENVDVGEVSVKQKVLMIMVMVVFLGLLGFVLCVSK